MTHSIGFIGLGRMGGGMALNLLKQCDQLYVYDSAPEALAPLVEAGANAGDSVADIANRCDLIFLCLPFAPEVRAVMFGEEGLCSGRHDKLTIIDTTTLDRNDALMIAQQADAVGVRYWDCPVSGMPFRAHDGSLTVMFGGTDDAFNDAKPYLEAFGEFIVHCGDLGCGQAMKAINNVIYNVNIAALCEMLPLSKVVGLDPDAVARVVTSASATSFAAEYFVPRMMARRFEGDFPMRDAYKDIVNVQRMGVETRASMPVVNAMIASYQAAMAAGYGNEPKSAMLKVYENVLGVEFKKPSADSQG